MLYKRFVKINSNSESREMKLLDVVTDVKQEIAAAEKLKTF